MRRAILALVLVGLVVGGVFAAGSVEAEDEGLGYGFNATGFPIVDETITMTMMGRRHAVHQVDWSEMAFFQDMEELTGIHFDFITPLAADYNQAKQLAFASGNLPDVFASGFITPAEEVQYGSEGTLIPLNDLMEEHMPILQGLIATDFPDLPQSVTTIDGNIYALPQLDLRRLYPLWINGKWLDALGLDMPTTTEELYDVLFAFRNEDPNQNGVKDEIPMTSVASGTASHIFKQLLSAFGLLLDGIQVRDDQVIYARMEPEYRAFLQYVNRLWENELIDPEIFTNNAATYRAKINGGLVGMVTEAWVRNAWPDAANSIEDFNSYPGVPTLTSPVNDEQLMYVDSVYKRGQFAITSENEYPEAMARWVDWLYGIDGLAMFLGEGYLWEWADRDALTVRPILETYSPQDESRFTPRPGTFFPSYGPAFMDRVGTTKVEPTLQDEFQASKTRQFEELYYPFTQTNYPDTYLTVEEQQAINAIMGDLNAYVDQMDRAFITGEERFDNYDEYLEMQVTLGIEDVIDIYQAAYDRWNSF